VAFVSEVPADIAKWLNANGVSFFEVPFSQIENPVTLGRYLFKYKPRILHFHYIGIGLFRCLAARLIGNCKIIVHDHSSRHSDTLRGRTALLSPVRKLRGRMIAYLIYRIVGVSEFVRSSVIEEIPAAAKKAVAIPNGIDVTRFEAGREASEDVGNTGTVESATPISILFVGHLDDVKGVNELLLAAAMLKRTHPQAKFMIVGYGPLEQSVSEFCNSADGANTNYLGRRDDVHALMREADIFVGPSKWNEAFGLTFAEASASRLPVVSTDIGGIPEVVLDETTGILCKPGNVDELVEALQRLIDNPSLRKELGDAGRQHILNNFSLETAVNQTISLYDL
jgi:glycosyltransferase involved in cell wall biosynthesis